MSRVERWKSGVAVGEFVGLDVVAQDARTTARAAVRSAPVPLLRGCRDRRMLTQPLCGRGAEPFVVDVFGDGRMLAARGALRIAAELDLAEARLERVEEEEASDERLADHEQQLDRLVRLERADDAGKDAEDPRLGAIRCELCRRRLVEEAAVARTLEWLEHGDLSFEAEDRSVDDR